MKILRRPPPATGKILLAVVAILALGALAWHWSPRRQVELHQRTLLRAVENHDWKKFGGLLAADYRDRWGHRREVILGRLPSAFQDFFACGVLQEFPLIETTGGDARVTARARFVGSGGPVAQFLITRSAELRQPFTFSWRRAGWLPWNWELTAVDQPEIEVPESNGLLP